MRPPLPLPTWKLAVSQRTTYVGLLWSRPLRTAGTGTPCVQECDEKGSVEGTKVGPVMEGAMLANSCRAHGDIPSTLSGDVHNGTVANNDPSSSFWRGNACIAMVTQNPKSTAAVMC
ncbi:unnamed protein product [Merluccius merluccius]